MASILVVEDHDMSRQVLTSLFTSCGHQVWEAADGGEALALARDNGPDLIITDVLLPKMDGIEFVRRLRQLPEMEAVPLLFYTATCRLPEELDLGNECGACHVVAKPADPQIILAKVNKLLGISSPQEYAPSLGQHQADFNAGLQLAVLMDLRYSLVSQREPEQLLMVACRAAREFLGCKYALLWLERKGKQEYYSWEDGLDFEDVGLHPPGQVLAKLRSQQQPVCWSGAKANRAITVPFASPSQVYGWISFQDKIDDSALTSGDGEMAMTLCSEAALAYENICLVRELQLKEKHLEQQVEERTAELEEARSELLRVQNLKSLGLLAGGIAHNFNNALTAILGHIQIARMASNSDGKVFRNLELAEKACFDAQSLTRELLTFADGGGPVKKVASLKDLIWSTVQGIKVEGVEITYALAPDLLEVKIDPGQISQVVANLVLNACQAMPQGGIIQVEAKNVDLTSDDRLPLAEGSYIRFSVTDHGMGIEEDALPNVFDPFFSTKESGHGLGLATAFSIIKNHDGHITVESKPGVGTRFDVYLPAAGDVSQDEAEPVPPPPSSGRLLLVEDNELIAQSMAELLGMHGYQVDTALDGSQGLRLYVESMDRGEKYDAVIMDLVIPDGVGGKEGIQLLLELDPQAKAIVASGYSNDPVLANYREYGFCGAFPKPYNIEDVVQQLRKIIGR